MFWRKGFHVLVISILLFGAIIAPSAAGESKVIVKASLPKHLAATYTVCASNCDFSSIQTAIDSVSPGDTLNLAAETFTESITIDKSLDIIGAGAENTIVQAANSPGIAEDRVVNVSSGINVEMRGMKIRYGHPEVSMGPSLGGGIYNGYSTLVLSDVSIEKNSAGDAGGGIFNRGSLTIINSIFSGNSAGTDNGGGIWHGSDGDVTITNVSMYNNSAGYRGGGIYNNGIISITNTIIWGNTAGSDGDQIYNSASSMIAYTDIQDSGGSGTGWDSSLGTDGGGNIDADPLFIDAANDNLHLGDASPAIDAGDNTAVPAGIITDLDGSPRFVDIESIPDTGNGTPPIVDMGAYEHPIKIFLPIVIK